MSKNWKLKLKAPTAYVENFPEYKPVTVQLLYNRGFETKEQVEYFLDPKYQNLHDPFLFFDMQKAVDRIWHAIDSGEKITVYSDYDADAVTANAVLQQTFRHLGVPVGSYVPDRFTEGYGLNIEAFEKLRDSGTTLVITVDCGTNSVDVADFCANSGIDLIITDHHEITAETPKSFALINPKNPAEQYPDDQITGVGVAYKLAQALLNDSRAKAREGYVAGWDKWLLDLVAIGTVADCHSLLGENRVLVSFGLKVLKKTKWLGLRMLMAAAGVDVSKNEPDTQTLGFSIAPRINAAGRLEHASIAVDLLLATDPGLAQTLAASLEQINKRRQDVTMRVVSEAEEQAVAMSQRKIILVSHAEWPKGVVGLAAGRLAERYKRPVIVLEKGEIESTGSVRTGNNIDVVDFLKAGGEHLVKFGGHKQAAGLTVETGKIEQFYSAILEYVEKLPQAESAPELEIDLELFETDLSAETVQAVGLLEPYGIGNPKPLFLVRGLEVLSTKTVGNNKKHLQLILKLGGLQVGAIGFNMGSLEAVVMEYGMIDIAGELLLDSWNGRQALKLKVNDLKKYDEKADY